MRTLSRRSAGVLILTALMLLAGCAAARLHSEGLAAVDRGDYEAGIAALGQAVTHDPTNTAYRIDYQARRDAAVQTLIAQGDAARRAGQLDAAGSFYRRVLSIDPGNDRARHGLEGMEADQRHAAALEGAPIRAIFFG